MKKIPSGWVSPNERPLALRYEEVRHLMANRPYTKVYDNRTIPLYVVNEREEANHV
jgi:hypothetical protein